MLHADFGELRLDLLRLSSEFLGSCPRVSYFASQDKDIRNADEHGDHEPDEKKRDVDDDEEAMVASEVDERHNPKRRAGCNCNY